MSALKLYCPDEQSDSRQSLADGEEPTLLPFPQSSLDESWNASVLCSIHVVFRAKTIHDNRECPHCDCADVEPLELADAVLNRSRLPIPGTGTLVGFHCRCCGAEWPVEHYRRRPRLKMAAGR